MSLAQFLEQFFGGLNEREIAWCVLRHYEGYPTVNNGDDLDLLVTRADFTACLQVLAAVKGARITAVIRRSYTASVFVDGIGGRGLHLHFAFTLSWKGERYLDEKAVLARARAWDRWPIVRAADPVDGAVAELLEKLLWDGSVKHRAREPIRAVFVANPDATRRALAPALGRKLADEIVARVVAGRFDDLDGLTASARTQLVLRNLAAAPARAITEFVAYAAREVGLRLQPGNLTTVAVMGVDGAGKTTVLDQLQPTLTNVAGSVVRRRVHPRIFYDRGYHVDHGVSIDRPHEVVPRGWLWSLVKVCIWATELFLAKFLFAKPSAMLELYDRYFDDVQLDPTRYRYGGPRWLMRLLRRVTVRPDLWILLNAPPEVLYSRKQEISFDEVKRQQQGYLQMLKSERNVIVLEATQPIAVSAAAAREAIVSYLAEKAAEHVPPAPLVVRPANKAAQKIAIEEAVQK